MPRSGPQPRRLSQMRFKRLRIAGNQAGGQKRGVLAGKGLALA